jgi:hypothetical protein
VAVKVWRRHQGGEAVEQLERGQALRATAAGSRFRGVVDEALRIEFGIESATKGLPVGGIEKPETCENREQHWDQRVICSWQFRS